MIKFHEYYNSISLDCENCGGEMDFSIEYLSTVTPLMNACCENCGQLIKHDINRMLREIKKRLEGSWQ